MNVALLSLGDDGAFLFFHAEHFFGDFDVHVGFWRWLGTADGSASRASRLLMWDSSVGRMSPPPLFTSTRHCPHELPPPAGGGDKDALRWQAREEFAVCSGIVSSFSPLGVLMVMSRFCWSVWIWQIRIRAKPKRWR